MVTSVARRRCRSGSLVLTRLPAACWARGVCGAVVFDDVASHRGIWPILIDDKTHGALPTLQEIDAMSRNIVSSEAVVGPPTSVSRPRRGGVAVGRLGPRDLAVPQAEHERLEQLAHEGPTPVTTLSQRKVLKQSIGDIAMGVPEDLALARDHGYIHPHVSALGGMVWRMQGSARVWKLCRLGG